MFRWLVLLLLTAASARAISVAPFASADLVLGQTNFTTGSAPLAVSASRLAQPAGLVVDPTTGKVFVADTGNNRILRFASASALANGANAELVFGQPDLNTNGSASPPTASSLDSPTGLALDASGRLWVADTDNHRVLMFPNAVSAETNGRAATLVLGQGNFTSEDATPPGPATMNAPQGLVVDSAGLLWVADTANNRVLRFGSSQIPAASLANGASVGGRFGQASITSNSAGSTNLELSAPTAVSMDAAGTLWIADTGNHRVVGFPSAAITSGNNNATNASRIVGQPDFNTGSNTPGTTISRMSSPVGVFADAADNLWVLDQGNNRVLRFATLSAVQNGGPATRAIGQPGFTDGSSGLTARRFSAPSLGLAVPANGALWVSDTGNNRVLRFSPTDDTAPTVRILGRRTFTTRQVSLNLRGTAGDDVGVIRVTVGRAKARGTTVWNCRVLLKPGRNVLKVVAFDASGRRSAPVLAVITRE